MVFLPVLVEKEAESDANAVYDKARSISLLLKRVNESKGWLSEQPVLNHDTDSAVAYNSTDYYTTTPSFSYQ